MNAARTRLAAVRARRRRMIAQLLRRQASALGTGGAMQVARTTFRAGELVSPQLSARLARRMWFRVPPAPPAAKRARGFTPGERLEVTVDGRRIAAYAWGEGPVVLLAHGWSGWWQQLGLYIEPLVAAGFRVVAWDAPSHGDSAPGRYGRGYSAAPELAEGLRAVAASLGDDVHGIVAHSVGAMAAILGLLDGVHAERVVLLAPSASGDDQVDFVASQLGWGQRTKSRTLALVERRYGISMSDFDLVTAVAGQALPPALILHDRDDTETPAASSERLAAAWPGARLELTTGLNHFKLLWSPTTVARTVAFLRGDA